VLNKVIVIGRLTKDPELRTTNSGLSVASFRVAVNRRSPGPDGTDADFFNVTCWRQTADFVANYLQKGRLVAVEGRLQNRSWTGQDGTQVRESEIVADSVQALDKPKDDSHGGETAPVGGHEEAAPYGDDDPFAGD